MRFWYLSHRRPAKDQASLRIRPVSPEPSLLAQMKYGSRRKVRPKIRHLAPLDGCACAFEKWVYGGRKSAIISCDGSFLLGLLSRKRCFLFCLKNNGVNDLIVWVHASTGNTISVNWEKQLDKSGDIFVVLSTRELFRVILSSASLIRWWLKIFIIYYRKKFCDSVSLYLVNVESMKSCFVCLETAFISAEFSMKFVVMVAYAEELRPDIRQWYPFKTLHFGAMLADCVSGAG